MINFLLYALIVLAIVGVVLLLWMLSFVQGGGVHLGIHP